MKVGIIGSGGREHSICETLSGSKKIKKILPEIVLQLLKNSLNPSNGTVTEKKK